MTTLEQLYFIKKGLKLKEVFILNILKRLSSPLSIDKILSFNPLIEMNNKNFRLTLNKLEKQNHLTRFRTSKGFIFAFSYINSHTNNHILRFLKPNKNLITIFNFGQNKPKVFYIYNYINNKINKHNLHNIHEEVIMLKHKDVINKNNYQLVQRFKTKFKTLFPTKNNYLCVPLPKDFNFEKLIKKIQESNFLSTKDNLGFSWMIKNYNAIISDYYAPFDSNFKQKTSERSVKGFTERNYTDEELNSLYDNLDDIKL